MSHNHGVGSTPPSRRSVVKGAAWAVPAVVVAAAAPTVAASAGLLTFTGKACKLPGNSQSHLQGLRLRAHRQQRLGSAPARRRRRGHEHRGVGSSRPRGSSRSSVRRRRALLVRVPTWRSDPNHTFCTRGRVVEPADPHLHGGGADREQCVTAPSPSRTGCYDCNNTCELWSARAADPRESQEHLRRLAAGWRPGFVHDRRRARSRRAAPRTAEHCTVACGPEGPHATVMSPRSGRRGCNGPA